MPLLSRNKGGNDDDDSSRRALFGNRKGGGNSGGSGGQNPYAQAPQGDPYAAPSGGGGGAYQRSAPRGPPGGGGGLPSGPRGGAGGLPGGPRPGGGGGLPGGPAPRKVGGGGNPYGDDRAGGGNPYGAAPKSGNPYGGMDQGDRYGGGGSSGGGSSGGGGYGSSRSGGAGGGGYGGDRYGGGGGGAGGGYGSRGGGGSGGGGGRYGEEDDDSQRNALFGNASDRYAQRQPGGGASGYGASYGDAGYGDESQAKYQDRQLTAEEQEEEDVHAVKDQIRQMKREDVSSTRNALRIAQMAEESGRDTLARLGAQGEHIHNAEKNLDLAHNQNKVADERARELKTLNRSMFAVHVSNPFTAGSRQKQRDQAVLDKHLDERETREATRREALHSNNRMAQAFDDIDRAHGGAAARKQTSLAERSKYQFEADSEDEDMENEIDGNLDLLSGAAGRLNQLARATNKEVDEQIRHLDRIAEKSDRVDVGLAANQAKLDRFK